MKLFLNWKSITFLLALIIGVGAGLLAEPTHSAFAQDIGGTPFAGRMCVFLAPNGASGLGHVGWGIEQGLTPHWFFGSVENRSGAPVVLPGNNTYSWIEDGTEQQMYETFNDALTDPNTGMVYHNAGEYTKYRCITTDASDANDALNLAQAYQGAGYSLPTGKSDYGYPPNGLDCLTETQQVLYLYDSSVFPNYTWEAMTQIIPNQWFYSLTSFEQPSDIPPLF